MNTRRIALPILVALLLAPLTACSSMTTGASMAQPGVDMAADAAGDGGYAAQQEELGSDSGVAGRSVIQEGSLAITVQDPVQAAEDAASVARDAGGYVESQNIDRSGSDSAVEAYLQLRVPSERLDAAFEELGKLGEVTSQSRSTTDVTAQHVDLQARVKALEASVERLTELISGATSTEALIEAESALSERQQELDGLRAQLGALEGLVDQASISVSISSKSALPGGGPTSFWGGLVAGWHSIAATGAGALVLLGVLLPWLALGAIIALTVVLIVRGAKRASRRRAARGEAAPAGAPTPPAAHGAPTEAASPGQQTPQNW